MSKKKDPISLITTGINELSSLRKGTSSLHSLLSKIALFGVNSLINFSLSLKDNRQK